MISDNDFVMDEALLNVSYKQMMTLIAEKRASGQKFTLLEELLAQYVFLNSCLAQLMGPVTNNETLVNQIKTNTPPDIRQFPALNKVAQSIELLMAQRHHDKTPLTDLEAAALKYLNIGNEIGVRLHQKAKE